MIGDKCIIKVSFHPWYITGLRYLSYLIVCDVPLLLSILVYQSVLCEGKRCSGQLADAGIFICT